MTEYEKRKITYYQSLNHKVGEWFERGVKKGKSLEELEVILKNALLDKQSKNVVDKR